MTDGASPGRFARMGEVAEEFRTRSDGGPGGQQP